MTRERPTNDERRRRAAFGLEPLPGADALGGTEFVYRQALDAILSQRLAPGTRLREEALAGIFEVGRATVRTALQRLAHEGAVELRANRGAIVARPGADETAEIIEARRVIECELARRVAVAERGRREDGEGNVRGGDRHDDRRGDGGGDRRGRRGSDRCAEGRGERSAAPAALEPLAALAREEGQHFEAGRRGAALRLAGAFHLALAPLGGNRPLADALARLVIRTSLAIGAYERPTHRFVGWRSRLALLEVVASGDGEAAAAAMRAHFDALERTLDTRGGTVVGELDAAFGHLKRAGAR